MSKGKSTYLQHLEEERIQGEQEPNVCLLPPTDKKRKKGKKKAIMTIMPHSLAQHNSQNPRKKKKSAQLKAI